MKTFYKLLIILIILIIDFVLLNQLLIPSLSCGSTIGELLAFLGIIILIHINFLFVKKETYEILIKIKNKTKTN
jgi:hypothetical protein